MNEARQAHGRRESPPAEGHDTLSVDRAESVPDPLDPANAPSDMPADPTTAGPPPGGFDESLTEELAALIDDGRTYFEAEANFQKTRAGLAGKHAGIALGLVAVAIVVLHVAVLALAVGLVLALEPLVTIWGAIAMVVGLLLFVTALLGWKAMGHGKRIASMFGDDEQAQSTEAES